jgi:hypothetical protein
MANHYIEHTGELEVSSLPELQCHKQIKMTKSNIRTLKVLAELKMVITRNFHVENTRSSQVLKENFEKNWTQRKSEVVDVPAL